MAYLDASGKPIPIDGPRALSVQELQRLVRNGFADLAETIAAGTCPDCELNRSSTFHRERCEFQDPPPTSLTQPAQPWVPRPSRRTRDGTAAA